MVKARTVGTIDPVERPVVAQPSGRSATRSCSALARGLATLPEGQRRAVEMHHLQGRSLVEIAEALGTTKAAVAGLLHRGLKALRVRLSDGKDRMIMAEASIGNLPARTTGSTTSSRPTSRRPRP